MHDPHLVRSYAQHFGHADTQLFGLQDGADEIVEIGHLRPGHQILERVAP